MSKIPAQVAEFLAARRIAIAGVSRDPRQPANLIYRKLRDSGHEVFPVNPNASELEGSPSYSDLRSIPQPVEAVMIATHPNVAPQIVRQCADLGIPKVWFHRSFGQGSVSEEALQCCKQNRIDCIVGGCPMMYCDPVDFGHICMKWMLRLSNHMPG